jgi:tetratricopeptide (TPR) repeat protein
MAQWGLLKQSTNKRCELMWNFLREIPKWLAQRVSAWIGREAHADAMYRGNSSSRNTHQADRSASAIHPLIICLIGIGTLNPMIVVFAAERCPATNATKVVSVQGNVTWNVTNNAALTPAKLNDLLCVGDTVQVGAKSRAVLRLPNQTTVPLDQNTIFRLKEAISDKEPTLIELIQGAIHVITRTPKPFKVDTPYLNALVEGTEFYVGVDNQEARVAVIEGKVNVSNEQGAVLLTDNEAASARKGQAPQKTLTIKPRDAVQWALYYPPLFDPRSRSGSQSLANAHELYSQGKITEAIESLDAIPETERNGDFYSYKAGLLLLVGRADEAEPDIETALRENGNNTDALSLKAIIAIVKNDKAKALELANQAVNIDDKSASARIALSYALQANFEIEDALKAAQEATLRDADNALAWARVAELELSIPNYEKSKAAAEQGVKLNPNVARTQSILGFANLTSIDINAAKSNFNRAIELDQADPLPRLGLGLATIREGNLEQGREQIEIAASLDPNNSLMRSYLGKAYYEEKRDTEAGKQFDLAKQHDPKDPTPDFYDAIKKQTENRPVEALSDLEKSIELNDNRAPYRSKLLLDSDAAARDVGLAQIYRDLGFRELAISEAARSVAMDPLTHSAHRFLSDSYVDIPRSEVARVSELLQSQLLQPSSVSRNQAQLPFSDIVQATPVVMAPAINEYSLLFNGTQPQWSAAAQIGNNRTWGDELFVAKTWEKLSLSAGQFHYETQGFRKNNDIAHDIYNAFASFRFVPSFGVQVELRKRHTEHGDVVFNFDPNDFSPDNRFEIDQKTFRLGTTFRPSSHVAVITSFLQNDREERQQILDSGLDIKLDGESPGRQFEVQFQKSFRAGNLVLGTGSSRVKINTRARTVDLIGIFGGACSPAQPCEFEDVKRVRQYNGYLYANFTPNPNLITTIGISRDTFDDGGLSIRRWNPKLGITWQAREWIGFRAAAFKTLKRTLVVDQTIEPTQVAGFNQFYDDFNGTETRVVAGAIDFKTSSKLRWTIDASRRVLRLGSSLVGASLDSGPFEEWKERTVGGGVYWMVSPKTSIAIRVQTDRFEREPLTIDDRPTLVSATSFPFTFKYFFGRSTMFQIEASHIKQEVRRLGTSSKAAGEDSFNLIDFGVTYLLPRRRGILSFMVKNVFEEEFFYLDDDFRSSQIRLPRFQPTRSVVLSGSFKF